MKVKDPVCGMEMEKSTAEAEYDYKGKMYYFCSNECKESFEKAPEEFVEGFSN